MKKNIISSVVLIFAGTFFFCAKAEKSYLWRENKYATIVSSLGQRIEESCQDVPLVCEGYHTDYIDFQMHAQTPKDYLRYAGFQLKNHSLPVFERYQEFFRTIRAASILLKGENLSSEKSQIEKELQFVSSFIFMDIKNQTFMRDAVEHVARSSTFFQKIKRFFINHIRGRDTREDLSRIKIDSNENRVELFAKKIDQLSNYEKRIEKSPSSLKISTFDKLQQDLVGSLSMATLDPIVQGNTPSFIMDLSFIKDNQQRTVKTIRMGTPTIGSSKKNVVISEEFKNFIQSKSKESPHVYISFQNMRPEQGIAKVGINNEYYRGKALHSYAAQSQGKLIVMSLEKNGPFYFQSGREYGAKKVKKDDFRETFKNYMISVQNTGNILPRHILTDDKIVKIINGVFDSFFYDKENLTIEERRSAIELVHHFLSDRLVYDTNASSQNRTCKDAIDRGGASLAMLYSLNVLEHICRQGESKSSNDFIQQRFDELPGIVFAPALQVRKRSILHERLVIFQNAMKVVIGDSKDCTKIKNAKKNGLFVFENMSYVNDKTSYEDRCHSSNSFSTPQKLINFFQDK